MMKHKKIFQRAADERLIEILAGDTEEILINKLITSYLYEYYRNNKDNCEKLRKYLNKIDKKYEEYEVDDFLQEIESKETYEETFFGSFLSDDSDVEEAKSFDVRKNSEAYEFSKKANRDGMHYVRKAGRAEVGDIKISVQDPSSLFDKATRHSIDRTEEDLIQIQADLDNLNRLYKAYQQNKMILEKFLDEISKLKTKFFIAQYRGITYLTTRWSQKQRKAHRRINEIELPVFSHAAYKRAGLSLDALHDIENQEENLQKLTKAANEIKEVVLLARKNEVYKYGNRSYDSLADLLQEIYTINYDGFHQLIRSELFKGLFPEGANPFISTGDRPYHALKYAYGIKPYEGYERQRLRPRWQKNGRAERPYSGKVYVSLHPVTDYDANGPTHVPSLNSSGRIVIDNLIVAEYESTFPGLIAENRTIATHVAKYPSFSEEKYHEIYEYKYGINVFLYYRFRELLKENPPHTPGNKSVKKLLGEWLCAFHEVRLIELARKAAAASGGVLIYRDINGYFSLDLTEATPFHSSTPQEKRSAAKEARKSRETGKYSPHISADSPEAFGELAKSMKKLFINNQKEKDALRTKWPAELFHEDDEILTLPDGNCAFNGVALFLYEKLTKNLTAFDAWYHHTIKLLGLALKKSYQDCIQFLSLSKKTPEQAQKLLSPILRKMVVEYMRRHQNFYASLYLERLIFILEALANQGIDIPDADSFLTHSFIKKKLEQLLHENGSINLAKHKLATWWRENGFLQYLEIIQTPAKSSGDMARWGGSTELDVLGKIFNFRLRIEYLQQRFELIGRLPSCPFNLSNATKTILEKLSYKSIHVDAEEQYLLSLYDLEKVIAYRNFPQQFENIRQSFINQMEAMPHCLTYGELINEMAVSEEESQAWFDFLVTRGIAKTNGALWVNNDHHLDLERIIFCLDHNINDQDWASLLLSINHNKTLPECSLRHNQNHWSYKKTSIKPKVDLSLLATRVQSFFRGYNTRKNLALLKSASYKK